MPILFSPCRFAAVLCLLLPAQLAFGQQARISADLVSGIAMEQSRTYDFEPYGFQPVSFFSGHPAFTGDKSLRFEVRDGDCGIVEEAAYTCDTNSAGHELSSLVSDGLMHDGEYWFSWAIYLPPDYVNIHPAKVTFAQFGQKDSAAIWMFQNYNGGLWLEDHIGNTRTQLLAEQDLLGKWQTIDVHVVWHDADQGSFEVYLNGSSLPAFRKMGSTLNVGFGTFFNIGIFRSGISRWKAENADARLPTQVVYFDDVRRGRTRAKH